MNRASGGLSAEARPLIHASVPVLREHGLAISQHFYRLLFDENPELKNLFNLGNQANGSQQTSLATAVLAYAANIDNLTALGPVIARIAHKHASVGVVPEHYPIVGRTLLRAIADVLGAAATPELLSAWAEAYGLLADELIAAEKGLYGAAETAPGQLRQLVVSDAKRENAEITSFYLTTIAGERPGSFLPGQYVSVAFTAADTGLRQLRQYSLSDAPSRPYWRITVKRESGNAARPPGRVSNALHAHVKAGDRVAVSAPFGNFNPVPEPGQPIALLSAGVGITPMISALNALADAAHSGPVLFAHAARSAAHRILDADVERARARLPCLTSLAFWEEVDDIESARAAGARPGRMELTEGLVEPFRDASFYLCGPVPFMREQWRALKNLGISGERIHREVFGPDLFDHLA